MNRNVYRMTSPYLPAGAFNAEFSEVSMKGTTFFSNNNADRYGGDLDWGRCVDGTILLL